MSPAWWAFWEAPPPPPPPPPPPSLHAIGGLTSEQCLLAAAACAVLAAVLLFVSWLSLSRSRPNTSRPKPFVSVDASPSAKDRIAVLSSAQPGADSALVRHVRRLLLQRGFAEVRSAKTPSEMKEACRGAHLAVDLAVEAPDGAVAASTQALLDGCAACGVRAIVQCTDALVGYDASTDVCDGDELSDPGISLISPEPRPPPPASGRLLELRKAEEAIGAHHMAAAKSHRDGTSVRAGLRPRAGRRARGGRRVFRRPAHAVLLSARAACPAVSTRVPLAPPSPRACRLPRAACPVPRALCRSSSSECTASTLRRSSTRSRRASRCSSARAAALASAASGRRPT